jgi:hypothetical protein
MVSYAVSMADLVIVPMQASQLDAPKAASMIRLIKQQERVARRVIPYVPALTRTSPAIITGTSAERRGKSAHGTLMQPAKCRYTHSEKKRGC